MESGVFRGTKIRSRSVELMSERVKAGNKETIISAPLQQLEL